MYLFPVWKWFWSCVYVFIYCVGAGITNLMSICDGSNRTLFCRKMERTRAVREEMDGRLFISRQSRHLFPLINNMIKVLFPICTLIWRVNNYVSRQGKVYIGEMKVQIKLYKFVAFRYCTFIKYCDCCVLVFFEDHSLTTDIIETWSLRLREGQLKLLIKDKFSLHHWRHFSLREVWQRWETREN